MKEPGDTPLQHSQVSVLAKPGSIVLYVILGNLLHLSVKFSLYKMAFLYTGFSVTTRKTFDTKIYLLGNYQELVGTVLNARDIFRKVTNT